MFVTYGVSLAGNATFDCNAAACQTFAPAIPSFGGSLAIGDVNGDGFGDVLVGAPATASAFQYLGTAGGLSAASSATLTGPGISNFGSGLALADVNGDGLADALVGAPGGGGVYEFLSTLPTNGLPTTDNTLATATWVGSVADQFGGPLQLADLDGDGNPDLVVSSWNYNTIQGAIYIYPGTATGVSTGASATIFGEAASTFGFSLSP
jgi:hypothetical protein